MRDCEHFFLKAKNRKIKKLTHTYKKHMEIFLCWMQLMLLGKLIIYTTIPSLSFSPGPDIHLSVSGQNIVS